MKANNATMIDYYITLDMAKELSMVERYEFVENQDFVRVVVDDTNNPLFVAKDVATVLRYARTTDAINRHCKGAAVYRPLTMLGRPPIPMNKMGKP